LAALYALPASPSALSLIARQGSGSACRSLFGGFVAWEEGSLPDGTDSFAVQIVPREYWPQMHALICVVSDDKKGTSSTSGMQRTVETSTLLAHRISHVVPARMRTITKAIRERDFDTFARVTTQDSNQFHAVALDTDPPIFYMNDVSRAIINIVVEYNRVAVAQNGKLKAAYTFDAGPNAVIYVLDENVREIVDMVVKYFPQTEAFKDPFGLYGTAGVGEGKVVEGFNEAVAKRFEPGAVKTLIHTRVGDGPRVLDMEAALLGADGLPKDLA
jgi:diphosphomevalonate decarboxylase